MSKAMSESTHPFLQHSRCPITERSLPLELSGPNAIPELWKAIFSQEQLDIASKTPMNIMTLIPARRIDLLSGPRLSIVADGNIHIRKDVPMFALLASSTKLYNLTLIKEQVKQLRIFGNVDHGSVEKLLDIFTTKKGLEAKQISLIGTNFTQDVLLYQACLSLGIYYVHSKPLLNTPRAEISARLLTEEERNTVANRVPPTDPLLKHLANDLCHRRIKKQIPDIMEFEKLLGHNRKKKLQCTMVEIDQEHKKRREACRTRVQKSIEEFTRKVKESEEKA
jgi:hypothetical protein